MNEIIDNAGVHGRIVAHTSSPDGNEGLEVEVGDRRVLVPVSGLKRRQQGYFLPARFKDFKDIETAPTTESITIPVYEERLQVDTRPHEKRVTVEKRVESRDELVDVPRVDEDIVIERVAVNREVDAPTEAHYEGETLVIPLFDEVVVTQKRLVLREEIRITKRRLQSSTPEKVTLRREEVTVRRDDT